MSLEREFPGLNYGYILELYDCYQKNPDAVDEATRRLFGQWKRMVIFGSAIQAGIDPRKLIGAVNLAQAIR